MNFSKAAGSGESLILFHSSLFDQSRPLCEGGTSATTMLPLLAGLPFAAPALAPAAGVPDLRTVPDWGSVKLATWARARSA